MKKSFFKQKFKQHTWIQRGPLIMIAGAIFWVLLSFFLMIARKEGEAILGYSESIKNIHHKWALSSVLATKEDRFSSHFYSKKQNINLEQASAYSVQLLETFQAIGTIRPEYRVFIDQVSLHMKEILAKVEQVSTIYQSIGREKWGFVGQWRLNIHRVEDRIKERGDNRLWVHLLQLRRHEKDYLLRLDSAYFVKWDHQLEELSLNIKKTFGLDSSIETDLKDYKQAFLAYHRLIQQIVDPNHNLLQDIEENVRLIGSQLDLFEDQINLKYHRLSYFDLLFSFLIIGITVVFLLAAEWLIRKHLLAPLQKISDAVLLVKQGQYDITLPTSSLTLIDDLVLSLNDLFFHLKQSVRDVDMLRYAIDQSTMVMTTTPTGIITSINRHLCTFTGYQEEDLLGVHSSIFKSGQHDTDVYQGLWQRISGGEVFQGEFYNKKKSGELYWIHASIIPIKNDKGEIIQFMAFQQDLTKEKTAQLERDLLQKRFDQNQKFRSVQHLSSGIAHEFNNILSHIVGQTSLLMRESVSIAHKKQYQAIIDFTKRGGMIANKLIHLTPNLASETDPLPVHAALSDLQVVLDSTVKHTLQWRVEPAETLGTMLVSQPVLKVLLENLIQNAEEAMGEKTGDITVQIGCLKKENYARYDLMTFSSKAYLEIQVQDHGIGMDSHHLAQVFDLFYTTKIGEAGSGLGLPMVQKVLQECKGASHISSSKGVGTTVYICLPTLEKVTSKVTEALLHDLQGKTVMVVDDEEGLRELYALFLEDQGVTVLTFADGQEAVSAFQKDRLHVDAIIMDGMMPNMDGIMATQKIKALSPDVPVILVSGYVQKVSVSNIDSLFVCRLQKPVNDQDIIQAIREAVSSKRRAA